MICSIARCLNEATQSNLCRKHADQLHPGQVFFKGRWRTIEEFHQRVITDPSMRGVCWVNNLVTGELVGTLGAFEIKLRGKS